MTSRNSEIFICVGKYCGIRSLFCHENIVCFLLSNDSIAGLLMSEIPKYRKPEKTPPALRNEMKSEETLRGMNMLPTYP